MDRGQHDRSQVPDLSMTLDLYDLPLYYDIAFSWDPMSEIQTLRRAMDEYLDRPAARLLEPGCGTGRLLVPLAMYGHHITGYDHNRAMLNFARDKITGTGLSDRISLIQGDFEHAAFVNTFDVAYNFIGSIGHLIEDRRIVNHLRATAATLGPGGIYVVQLACLWEDQADYEPNDWTAQRDDISVDVHWEIEEIDLAQRRTKELSRLTITHGDLQFVHEDRYPMRLWLYEDWIDLVDRTGCLQMVGVYDQAGDALDLDEPVIGEDGNCYFVLRKT